MKAQQPSLIQSMFSTKPRREQNSVVRQLQVCVSHTTTATTIAAAAAAAAATTTTTTTTSTTTTPTTTHLNFN